MNDKNRGFTLIELLIVVGIISIMSGSITKVWVMMQKMSNSAQHNLGFTFESHKILAQLSKDIRHSTQVARSEQSLLNLVQHSVQGQEWKVVYRIEKGELIRDAYLGEEQKSSIKIATLDRLFLDVAFLENRCVRLEVRRRPSPVPMEQRNHQLTAFVYAGGES